MITESDIYTQLGFVKFKFSFDYKNVFVIAQFFCRISIDQVLVRATVYFEAYP
jgi:hypothetical protein